MKNIYFLLIALFVTTGSYSQYRVFHFIGSEKGKKNIVKQALLKDLKESSEVRIKNGDLKGLDIWQTISGAGDGYTDFVVVELYDDLTNYHKNRSLGKNLKWNPDESKKFWENWNSASSDNNYRIILKVEAFDAEEFKRIESCNFGDVFGNVLTDDSYGNIQEKVNVKAEDLQIGDVVLLGVDVEHDDGSISTNAHRAWYKILSINR